MKLWTLIPGCMRFKISSNVQSLSDKIIQYFTTKKLRQFDNVISIKYTIKHLDMLILKFINNQMKCNLKPLSSFIHGIGLGDEY